MQAASRESLAKATERLDQTVGALGDEGTGQLADELFAVLHLLARERVLRRHLADPSTATDSRKRLVEGVLDGKIGPAALDTVVGVATSRWSTSVDLLDALELLARQAVLATAESDGVIEDVEDELFRFSRILDSQSELRILLSDAATPVEGRVALLDRLITDKVRSATRTLLDQVVRLPRGVSLEVSVSRLAELAAARRHRSVAHVTAAAPLTDAQERRLAQVLSTIFGRAVSVQVELDPDVLGGLVIRVGDEVIDGSVAARLAKARQDLPG
ncbi:MAG TPA: F0F1 ATP synthase subunit delta [Pseudonocardiaceae bacterium]|jgi:F-type H+-transporting ATPase subunit delta|nr:F0F1 ATP synthase subunit delta [Pseudonocardiaceae bacterium]